MPLRKILKLQPTRRSIFGFLAGVLFALSTPPVDFAPAILLALVALAVLSADAPSTRAASKAGFFFGFGANLVILRFVVPVIARFTPLPAPVGWLALVLLAAFQAGSWAAAAAVSHALARSFGVPRPAAFAIGVYFAGFLPGLFPWTVAGALGASPVWIQSASLVGDRGSACLVAGVCGLLAAAVQARSVRGAALGALAGGLLWLSGALAMRNADRVRETAPRALIGLVQPGVEATTRWDEDQAPAITELLRAWTLHAEFAGAELTVWPEAAYPYVIHPNTTAMPRGNVRSPLRGDVRGPILFGAVTRESDGIRENSAYVVGADGALSAPQHKRHLLWFGETVPFADSVPFLRKTFGRALGMRAGHESVPLVSGRIRAAVLNCYEDTLTASSLEAARVGPNLLVNITNDAWFIGTHEGALHERLSVLRAIELRRDLVRAVNLGVSTHVDSAGRMVFRYASQAPAANTVSAALLDGPPTLFARFGDFPLLMLVTGALAYRLSPLCREILRRRRDRRSRDKKRTA